ncbi:Muscle, skeletal receptor tyrosine protein kinase [Stylophora pistillata]|uniref:Muscle, skeletal receptor tyrosine protein kinase n=1 Tax=Stylophora pistillata TaxID=50429 RepID=A0A2B4S2X9_STYPI|nr:Muscle, skeletal receptor tyrosine protein kinase [Stylophora pistillata]
MEKISRPLVVFLVLSLFVCTATVSEGAFAPPRVNCSTIAPDEKVGCVVPENTNKTTCLFLGCCWNDAETDSAKKCYTKRGGSCMPYRGKVCQVSLNSSLPFYRNSDRFFDNKYGLPATEQFLARVLQIIDQLVKDNEKCRYILTSLLCHYTVPPCYPDGTDIKYCRGDCAAIFKECSAPLNQVIGALTLHVAAKNIDFIHTSLPNCSGHPVEESFKDRPEKTCIKTGFFNYTETTMGVNTGKPTPQPESKLEIILPIVIVCLFIIAVCVIVFALHRRHKKRRDAVDNGHALTQKGSITMRDRLRAESLKSLDSRLLGLYDPNKLRQYRLDHVQYVKDLGEGFFGKVFQGRASGLNDKQSKKVIPVAVKALKDEPSKEQKDEFFREVTLMSILTHPNIVQLLAVSTEEEPYGMLLEFMSGGDLNQYLRNALPAETSLDSSEKGKVYLSQEVLVSAATQIAAGMQYLAEMKFVHRDLATRNCLVGDDFVVKIGDFGMSRDIYTTDYYKMSKETLLPIRWLAPEAFLYGKFSLKSDVYAYGVVLWEIFTFGLQPYYGYTNKEVMEFIQKGIHLGKPDNCPDFVYAIMKDCWTKEAEKRLEFTAISRRLKNPYHDYDMPPATETDETIEQREEAKEGDENLPSDTGNYDIPRNSASSDYDIPRAKTLESNYDVPRSNEDIRMSTADNDEEEEKNEEAPSDVAV